MPVLSTLGGASAFGFGLNRLAAAIGALTDEYWANTVLLLNADGASNGGQNNTFLDSSSNAHTITRNGNVTQGSFSPFSVDDGKWGVDFSASDASVRISDNADLNLTGEFTIELWARQDEYGPTANNRIFQRGVNSITGYCLLTSPTTKLVKFGRTDETIVGFTQDLSDGIWHHFAVTRDASNLVRLYFDGVLKDSATMSDTLNQSGDLFIGSYPGDAADRYSGSISNFRLVNGTALYTGSSLTVPTNPLTDVANTKVLTCLSNRFTDSSANNLTVTPYKDAKVVPFSPFPQTTAYSASTNGGSGYFDGSGDYLSIADDDSFDLGGGEFTVELWFYLNSVGDNIFITNYQNSTSGYSIRVNSNVIKANLTGDGYDITGTTIIKSNTWYHVALSGSSGSVKLFLNGVQEGSTFTGSLGMGSASPTTIGALYLSGTVYYPVNGYIANARIVKGTALYTSAFTPPTAPVTEVSGTSLLCNFTNASIVDATGKNVLETVGNAQVDTTTFKYGTGAMEFDGTGDRLVGKETELLAFGTGDYTIEFWMYPRNTSYGCWIDTRTANPSTDGISIFNSGTTLDIFGPPRLTVSDAFTLNDWQHFALTRSGTSMRAFVNGTQVGATTTSSENHTAGRLLIGEQVQFNFPLDGYIDDLRITKGIARYTANFTPPEKELPVVG